MAFEAATTDVFTAESAPDDIIEGEYNESSGVVPVPDDLIDENGSPRYALPDELVKYRYDLLPLVSVAQPVPLAERIVVSLATTPDATWYDLGPQEATVRLIGERYAFRVASLRDAKYRLRATEEKYRRLQEVKEQERINLNWRNSVYNAQIEAEIKQFERDWQKRRDDLNAQIITTEEALINYRMKRQVEIEAARSVYWEVRDTAAKERDVRDHRRHEIEEEQRTMLARLDHENQEKSTRLKWDREQESEQERRKARQRMLAQQDDETALRKQALEMAQQRLREAEHRAVTAEQEAEAIELRIATEYDEKAQVAKQRYESAFDTAVERIESELRLLEEEARRIEAELLAEKREREEWLHCIEREAADRVQQHHVDLHRTHKEAETAAARAGRGVGHDEDTARLSEDVIAEGTSTTHLALPERHNKVSRTLKILLDLFAHIALGSIFGISLGLLTGIADLTPEGLRKTGGALVGVCILGVFVFFLMGRLASTVTSYAAEEFDADRNAGRSLWQGRAWLGAIAAFLVIFGMITLEAYVERYGIVQSVVERQQEMGGDGTLPPDKQIAFWMIALIVSAPFVVYHAYLGAMETRYRLAEKRRRERLAVHSYDVATSEAVRHYGEAIGIHRATEAHLERHDQEREALRAEAERRIMEIDALLVNHVALVRWQTYLANRNASLQNDPLVIETRSAWEDIRTRWDHDAVLVAARGRAATARTAAEEARLDVEQARGGLIQSWNEAIQQIVASTGTGIAQVLGEKSGDVFLNTMSSLPSNVLSAPTGGLAIAGQIGQMASGLLPRIGSAAPTVTPDLATWEETMAKERWDSLRNAISHDPQVRFYQSRIASLQRAIKSMDVQFGKRRSQLREQRRAIEVRMMESEESHRTNEAMRMALLEADQDLKAAHLSYSEELELLMRLTELPGFLRWIEVLRQRFFIRTVLQRQLIAARSHTPSVQRAIEPKVA